MLKLMPFLFEVQVGKGTLEKLVPKRAHGDDITNDIIILDGQGKKIN